VNSMAGFPEGGNKLKSAIDLRCAGPVSLSSYVVQQQGPGPRTDRAAKLGFGPHRSRDCTITRWCGIDKTTSCHDPLVPDRGLSPSARESAGAMNT
jgi:hypothetical protein